MSTPRQSPIEILDEKATLRARVVELQRENDLLKQAQRAHSEAGGDLQTSGTEGTPEPGSLGHIYSAAPVGLCYLDTKLRYVFINEWLAAINGLSVDGHLGRSISEVLPDVAVGVEAQLRRVIETGEPIVEGTVEAETAAEPGVKRHFQHNYDAIRSADGIIVGVSCVVQDVTTRKQAEAALRLIVEGTSWALGEEFFRSLTRHLALALEVRFAFVSELHKGSEARLRLLANWEGNDFGENFEYDVGGTPCELVIEKGLAYYPANVQQLFPDDHWLQERCIESYLAVPLVDSAGNCLGHLGVTDVKPMPKSALAESILRIFAGRAGAELLRKRTEELLEHTQFAVEHCSNPIYWVRKDGGIIYANEAACRSVGYTRDELLAMSVPQLDPDFPEKDWPADWQELSKAKRSTFESHHRRKDGCVFPVQITTSFLEYEFQDFIWAYVTDITERKRAEEALRESEVKYRELFESAHDVICFVDGEGNIVDINRRGELLTGYSRAELRQMNVLDQLVVPEDHAVGKQVLKRAAPEAEHVYEVRWRTKQGTIVHFEGASTYRFSASGEFMSTRCTLRDITERKRAEEHARQLQGDLAHMSRLSSMGEMAAGLAHELNQPLTVITNYAQGCVRRLKSNAISEDELENVLIRIATQAQRSSSIIRGLGNLVRKSSARRTDIDVNQSIIEVAEMANAEATQHHAKARFELEPNLPLVLANQTQLQQVILNLVQNGCEATEDTPESRRAVAVRSKQRGDRELEISVSDNGRGISESLAERLFEPFFTTKVHGIGMGLAISRSIVESHGGRLWATPNRGKGTTFHFTLPIARGHGGDE